MSLIPCVVFLLFGLICAMVFLWKNQGDALEFFCWTVLVSLALVVLFGILVFSEVNYFNQYPSSPLTVFENDEFSIGDDKSRRSLTPGTLLRYTLHYPAPDAQGASTFSELDLVLRDGSEVVSVHKIMAHSGNGCWRHAQQISRLGCIPLKRIALQANGKPFPPALPN